MATRVTDGASALVSRVSRVSQLPRSRARALLSKSEEKERLFAVYLSSFYMTTHETSLVVLSQLGC